MRLKIKRDGSLSLANTPNEQKFTKKFIVRMLEKGLIDVTDTQIILHDAKGDVTYKIVSPPGTYCAYCKGKLETDPSGATQAIHILQKHKGEKNPNADAPAGYVVTHYYDCELVASKKKGA